MVTAVSGLTHLEGETVQIRGDGAILPDEVVASGAITLDFASGEVVVGLPYTTTIKTLSQVQCNCTTHYNRRRYRQYYRGTIPRQRQSLDSSETQYKWK